MNQSTYNTEEGDILMTSSFDLQGSFGKQLVAANTTGLLSNILQGDNCEEWNTMDCDEEEVEEQRLSSHRLIRGGSGMVSHDSTGSLDSTCSSSSTPEEYEPELSQSFGSTRSYDLMTPIKPSIALHGSDHHLRIFRAGQNNSYDGRFSTPNSPLASTLQMNTPLMDIKSHHLSQQRQNLGEMLGVKLETQTKSPRSPKSGTLGANRIKAPGLAGRLKINLPSSSALGAALAPQTPGGHIASGARDGAATGGPPLSPFEPPTPLCATAAESSFFATSRPKLQQRTMATPLRHNSANVAAMSPITQQFAAVSMRKASSSKGESTSEGLTSLLTAPFPPLAITRSLPGDLDGPVSPISSASSSVANPAKTKAVRSAVSPRPKQVKNKVSPYPLPREESPAKAAPTPADATNSYFPTVPAVLKDITNKPCPSLIAPPMEKCVSEPVPKTVSARHLAHRTLHPVFAANYTLGDELGSGGFGFVVKATRDCDGMPVAVKFIWKEKVSSHGWVRDDEFGAIPMEAFVLKVVDNPFIVKFVDLFDDDQFFYLVMEHHGTPWKAPSTESAEVKASKPVIDQVSYSSTEMKSAKSQPHALLVPSPSVAIFAPESNIPASLTTDAMLSIKANSLPAPPRPAAMERKSSCDLFECIEQHSRLGEDKARWVFAQIVEAVYYLDKRGICHRDIKDENCVIDSDFNVKLIDFGSSVITDPRRPTPYFNRFFGTMTFASSEILQGKQYRAPHAEVWSLGVLLSILLSGECPFADPTAAIRGKISRPSGSWSSDALNLLMACLVVNPDKRATIAQIRQHPWVTKAWLQRGQSRPGDDDLFAFARSA